MSRARFVTGARTTTVYRRSVRPKRVFTASHPGLCPLCTNAFAEGTKVMWHTKVVAGQERHVPAHEDCVRWRTAARNNPRSKDGGWGVSPGRKRK